MSGAHDEDPPPWQTTPAPPHAADEGREPPAGDAPPWQSPPREAAHGPPAQWQPPTGEPAPPHEQGPPGWQGPSAGPAPAQAEAPPGYWQPPPGWQPGSQRVTWQPAPRTPGGATASLLVGITAAVLLPPVGPVAVWLGSRAKRRIDASQGALGGRAVANWGVVMGWIGVLLTLVMAALIAIYFADN